MFCLHVCLCTTHISGAHRSHKRALDSWNQSYGWFWATVRFLGTEIGSSVRAMSVFNIWVIAPTPRTNSFEMTSVVVSKHTAYFESDEGVGKVPFISLQLCRGWRAGESTGNQLWGRVGNQAEVWLLLWAWGGCSLGCWGHYSKWSLCLTEVASV